MERTYPGGTIRIASDDITTMRVDAIVNAANPTLLSGGGIDGAIHSAAGPKLLAACQEIGGCPTGDARITPGFDLPARWVIHAVGPIWRGGGKGERDQLARAYRSSMQLAQDPTYRIRTIAFPLISSGIYGYPLREAMEIAVDEIDRGLAHGSQVRQVTILSREPDRFALLEEVAMGLLE